MKSVVSTAPTRVDLAGGALDIWPMNLLFDNPVTLNMAIDIMVTASVAERKDKRVILESEDLQLIETFDNIGAIHHKHKLGLLSRIAKHFLVGQKRGVHIKTGSAAPAGAGLAGSSALNIALCGASARYAGAKLNKARIIDIAKDIEAQLLGVPTGLQDYGAAMYGGIHAFAFPPGGMERVKLADAGKWLAENVLLFYSGKQRNSGINNWEMMKRVIDGQRGTISKFRKIAQCANSACDALLEADYHCFTKAVNKEWKTRKALFPSISTPGIDSAMDAGKKAGAEGARICGAGGGGCFFLLAQPDNQAQVIEAVEATGSTRLPYKLCKSGLQVFNR